MVAKAIEPFKWLAKALGSNFYMYINMDFLHAESDLALGKLNYLGNPYVITLHRGLDHKMGN
ncbi:MAG: Uncharacterised protein [Oceanospirillaceae bacterium UBA2001]|nr:MAG: Uncharacterised protein [Oceanospirillaceae bacterium UBA2001]